MNLFEDVKNYLDITWDITDAERQKLEGMIERGKRAISGKIGECDFDGDTQEKSLLLNYVMYDRFGALSDFWQHYRGEIISLRLNRRITGYEESKPV